MVVVWQKQDTIQLPVNDIHTRYSICGCGIILHVCGYRRIKCTFLWYYISYNEAKSVGCAEVQYLTLLS